ncbi:hypothetical protein ACFC6U_19420 [Kitasatospora purpeofusca]|uniref:hypothetical protein n=1 Tax=Kitasatospora purpeofusca TaxID=67352 RepID=UPI0035D56EE5
MAPASRALSTRPASQPASWVRSSRSRTSAARAGSGPSSAPGAGIGRDEGMRAVRTATVVPGQSDIGPGPVGGGSERRSHRKDTADEK